MLCVIKIQRKREECIMIDFKNSSFVKLKLTKPEAVMKDIEPLLINDELVIGAYKSIRDFVVFIEQASDLM